MSAEDVLHISMPCKDIKEGSPHIDRFGIVDVGRNANGLDGNMLEHHGGSLLMQFQIPLQPIKVVGVGLPEIIPKGIGPDNKMPLSRIEGVQ